MAGKLTVKRPSLEVASVTLTIIYDPAQSTHPGRWNWVELAGFGDGVADCVGFEQTDDRPATEDEVREFVASNLGVSTDLIAFEKED